MAPTTTTTAENLRKEGTELFKMGKFTEALAKYEYALVVCKQSNSSPKMSEKKENRNLKTTTEAISESAIIESNISATHLKLGNAEAALEHAHCCIELEPGWAKSHVRRAAAFRILGEWPGCSFAYMVACKLEPSNSELQDSWQEAWDKTVSITGRQLGIVVDFIQVSDNLSEIDIQERKLRMERNFPGHDVMEDPDHEHVLPRPGFSKPLQHYVRLTALRRQEEHCPRWPHCVSCNCYKDEKKQLLAAKHFTCTKLKLTLEGTNLLQLVEDIAKKHYKEHDYPQALRLLRSNIADVWTCYFMAKGIWTDYQEKSLHWLCHTYSLMGQCCIHDYGWDDPRTERQNLKQALQFYKQSLSLTRKMKKVEECKKMTIEVHILLGDLYLHNSQFKEAEKYLKLALGSMKTSEITDDIKQKYKEQHISLGKLFIAQGHPLVALTYLRPAYEMELAEFNKGNESYMCNMQALLTVGSRILDCIITGNSNLQEGLPYAHIMTDILESHSSDPKYKEFAFVAYAYLAVYFYQQNSADRLSYQAKAMDYKHQLTYCELEDHIVLLARLDNMPTTNIQKNKHERFRNERFMPSIQLEKEYALMALKHDFRLRELVCQQWNKRKNVSFPVRCDPGKWWSYCVRERIKLRDTFFKMEERDFHTVLMDTYEMHENRNLFLFRGDTFLQNTDLNLAVFNHLVMRVGNKPKPKVSLPLTKLIPFYAMKGDLPQSDQEELGFLITLFMYCQLVLEFMARKIPEECGLIKGNKLKNICSVCHVSCDKKCGRCENAYYCSTEHQKEAWQVHKEFCDGICKVEDSGWAYVARCRGRKVTIWPYKVQS